MATPLHGDDTGIGYGVLGTSIPSIGVIGEGGKPPIVVHPGGGTAPASGVYGVHNEAGYGVYGSSISGVGVHGSSASNSQPSVEGLHSGGYRRPGHQFFRHGRFRQQPARHRRYWKFPQRSRRFWRQQSERRHLWHLRQSQP